MRDVPHLMDDDRRPFLGREWQLHRLLYEGERCLAESWAGRVQEVLLMAFSNNAPSTASRSMRGLVLREYP